MNAEKYKTKPSGDCTAAEGLHATLSMLLHLCIGVAVLVDYWCLCSYGCDGLVNKMQLPCSVCGTILQVQPDTEFIYCTMCGTRVELGVHSYRTVADSKKGVYCISCDQRLNPDAIGTIFSCDNCNEHVCSICGKLSNKKHYCPDCYTKLIPELEKPKKTITRAKKGKVSKKPTKTGKLKPKSGSTPKKTQPKKKSGINKGRSPAKSKGKTQNKVKDKRKSKAKGKDKSKSKKKSSKKK